MGISEKELLAMACEFDLGPEPILNGRAFWWEKFPQEAQQYHVYVKNTGNPNCGPDRWGIFREGKSYCLNKLGKWEYQSLPSNRQNDFYERCRFDTAQEAIVFYRHWNDAVLAYAKRKIAAATDKDKVIINYEEVL